MLPIPWGSSPQRSHRRHATKNVVRIFNGLYPRNRGGQTIHRPRLLVPLGPLLELPVHWDGRQTVPCILGCRFCANGDDPRGAGYIPALLTGPSRSLFVSPVRTVWCIPEGEYAGDAPTVTGDLRNRVFEVYRDFHGDLIITEQEPLSLDFGIDMFSVQDILNPHFANALPELTTLASALTPTESTPASPTTSPIPQQATPPALSAVALAKFRQYARQIGKGGAP